MGRPCWFWAVRALSAVAGSLVSGALAVGALAFLALAALAALSGLLENTDQDLFCYLFQVRFPGLVVLRRILLSLTRVVAAGTRLVEGWRTGASEVAFLGPWL